MKKIITALLIFFSFCFLYAEDELYEDLTKENYAYRAIENLVYKGIFTTDSKYFNGEDSINKYQLAYYLSRALNKIDDEKASKDDLLIIENLVIDFSRELNKFGFDVEKYMEEFEKIEEKIEKRDSKIEENRNNIEKLMQETENLLKSQNRIKSSVNSTEDTNTPQIMGSSSFDFNINHKIYLDQEIFGQTNSSKITFNNGEIEIELGVNSEEEDSTKLNLDLNTNLLDNLALNLYNLGKKIERKSFYNHVEYLNGTQNNYNSYGMNLNYRNSYILFDSKDGDDLNVLNRLNFKYFDTTILYEPNKEEENLDFEILGKYSFIEDKFLVAAGYSDVDNYTYINTSLNYSNKNNSVNTLYEMLNNTEETISNSFELEIEYEVIENGILGYTIDIYDIPVGMYYNNQLMGKNTYNNWEFFLKYKMVSLKEPIDYSLDRYKNEKDEIDPELIKQEIENSSYNDLIVKIIYNLTEELDFLFSYKILIDSTNTEKNTIFFKTNYDLDSNKKLYFEFLKNDQAIDEDTQNIDYDDYTNYIAEYEKNKITLGIEMNF